jgi:hypothetical protein
MPAWVYRSYTLTWVNKGAVISGDRKQSSYLETIGYRKTTLLFITYRFSNFVKNT